MIPPLLLLAGAGVLVYNVAKKQTAPPPQASQGVPYYLAAPTAGDTAPSIPLYNPILGPVGVSDVTPSIPITAPGLIAYP
jgi:hypothetical protein